MKTTTEVEINTAEGIAVRDNNQIVLPLLSEDNRVLHIIDSGGIINLVQDFEEVE